MVFDPDELSLRLAARPRAVHDDPGRAASVLVPFFWKDGAPHLLFIRRTDTMRKHSGQYAFPGGRRDPTDADAVQTALRETFEEVGVQPQDVRVLGLLDDLPTVTNYVVTPVVGVIPHPYTYQPNREEVALIAELPLHAFLRAPESKNILWRGIERLVHAYTVDEHFIWGATAQILRNLTDVLTGAESRRG